MGRHAGTTGHRLVALAVAAVALVAFTTSAAGAAANPDTPERAVLLVIGDLAAGNAAAAWPHLHPAQQRVVPLKQYVACRAQRGLPLDAANTRVLSKSTAKITVPGTHVKATAVNLVVKVALTTGQTQNIVVREVRAKNSWRYILNQPEVTACRKA